MLVYILLAMFLRLNFYYWVEGSWHVLINLSI